MKKLLLTQSEFDALPEYSASYPTGTTPGKRWKRHDGAHDREFISRGGVPKWQVLEYDPECPDDAMTITVFTYEPVIVPDDKSITGPSPHQPSSS